MHANMHIDARNDTHMHDEMTDTWYAKTWHRYTHDASGDRHASRHTQETHKNVPCATCLQFIAASRHTHAPRHTHA